MAGALEEVRVEDYVEYFLFPQEHHNLTLLLAEINAQASKYINGYIWHRDPFHLRIANPNSNSEDDLGPHFYGVTHFGDNIEDEWFIVSLLIFLTRQVPGLVVRIIDSDGEFLLIEAAECLPPWAGPETCSKRVYLCGGAIHLVTGKDTSEVEADINSCVKLVRDKDEDTKASDEVQYAIHTRVKGYPAKAKENLHHCNVYVPITVAALLEERPQLVAPAVQAFCDRDSLDIKACRAMRFFPPETRVLTRVAFTRCLFAALARHRFIPDRCTGWCFPAVTSPEFASYEIGAKLASGFEVLVARAKPREGQDSRAWHAYLEKLKARGYFQGLLEGSQKHAAKLTEARQFFEEHGPSAGEAVGESILNLLSHLEIDVEKLRAKASSLPPSESDSWLEVTPQELDELLNTRYGSPRKGFPNRSDASQIPDQLGKFLEHISGIEGAEFPGGSPPTRPKRGVKKGKLGATFPQQIFDDIELSSSPAHTDKINFNPEAFSCAVQNILDFALPDDNWDLESNSDLSSFEGDDTPNSAAILEGKSKGPVDTKLQEYMKQMDQELSNTTLAQSFDKEPAQQVEDSFDDIEDFRPVDINLTALRNVLASYQAELGVAPGPASSLLGPMGVHLETMINDHKTADSSSVS